MKTLERLLVRFIFAGCVLWISFCGIAGILGWWVVDHSWNHGDDTGLGIICISIPLAILCAGVILTAFERSIRPRVPAMPKIDGDKPS